MYQNFNRNAPSRRTPSMPTWLNNVDNIERHMQEDGHRKWGFVIYRCTYNRDSDWEEFIKQLRDQIQDVLSTYNGSDMRDGLALTVFDDKAIFDHASTSAIREHFKQWAATAPQQEQGTGLGFSQRYRYCIQVDEKALESVIYGGPPEWSNGFVNLIWKDWEPILDPEESEEPIEGCTQHNVGWMMVASREVMVDMYHILREENHWYSEYHRPPQVALA
ncbi:hypothetical protein K432DRAFT_314760 [Lepidopterella palustris CBS 459.81]|uniref:Uncharacterized protein n=1 Tax=Lepidopterella palustris CBS 459.81 TaxID=1314670 RepID=A0A8E2J8K8_9PEZI|nr:hypothetical protein K432DRAFT_314760 [Lepidopterella palustris CBS 459.81]